MLATLLLLGLMLPATAPATDTADLDLRRMIANLQTQIAELKRENADLKRQLTQTDTPPHAKSTFTSRAEDYIKGGRVAIESTGNSQRIVPMQIQPQEAAQVRSAAAQHDKAIADYCSKHKVPDEVRDSLYEGRPIVGMTEDQLKLLGNVSLKEESANVKTITLLVWMPVPSTWQQQRADTYHIDITDGRVANIFRLSGMKD